QEPLRKIRAFGDRLISKYMDVIGDDGRNYIERIQDGSARMPKLLDDLLPFSRISRPQEPYEPVDFNKVVQEVLNDLEIAIESKQVQVHVGQLPVLHARTGQIRQLFQNLISNAVKFSRDDVQSEIHIDSQVLEKERKPNKLVRIRVRDNGIGFDEKYAEDRKSTRL